jgi:methylmalonyl-CoA/ethylmalonyl-CoA epimerase
MAKVAHIGIAVRDIEGGQRFYSEVLGLKVAGRETTDALNIAFMHAGETEVELLEPREGHPSAVAKFLETRGEGLHHIAFAVDDVEAALARAKAAGYTLIDEKPRGGAGGMKIAFVHPKGTHGVLVEFVQPAR